MTVPGIVARSRRALIALFAGAALAAIAPGATAADAEWPSKPIRFVVPYPPGGPLDAVARLLAEKLHESLGQRVVVENRAGAGGNIGADNVAKSAPDGHSIVMGAVATHAINPHVYAKMPYDAIRDFAPITRVAKVPNVLVMNPATAQRLGVSDVRSLIAYAKRNPGRLNYASGGNGSAGHLAGELFKSMAGVSMVHIPYKGAAPAQLGLMAGDTDLMFDNLASATPQIRSGRLTGFAVTTAKRSSFFPELPSIAESGLAGFDIDTWFGVFAPAGTPEAIVQRLHTEFEKALLAADVRERMALLGAEPAPMTPREFGEFVRSEQQKYARIARESGAKAD